MSTTIQFKRGTRSELEALAVRRGLSIGEPFLITDENRFAIATSDRTFSAFNLQGEVTGGEETTPPVSITKSLTLNSTDWQDTGIIYNNLNPGTYILQMYANDGNSINQWYSGLLSWNSGTLYGDNTDQSDEILLNSSGSSSTKSLFLRTLRTDDTNILKLQIYSSYNSNSSYNYVFKFKNIMEQ